MKKFKVVIPARHKSSRFPGKPLTKILGKEMILHVAERALGAVDRSQLIIATDSMQIANVVRDNGFAIKLTSDQHPTGTDRVWEAIKDDNIDFVINIQGDEPMFHPEDLVQIIKAKIDFPDHVVNGMADLMIDENESNVNIPKVVHDESGTLLYMSRQAIPGSKANEELSIPFKKQVCLYGFNKEHLEAYANFGRKSNLEQFEDIEILRFFEVGIPVKMITLMGNTKAVDIPEDVPEVEELMRAAY
ncbi:MAG: 3-deoxy-manno-octulosonate cytidylyltransferase [Candidatus Marinamargulisbacteria bacterium]